VEQDFELIREFVIESSENLNRLDREMVDLEQRPEDANLLASIFRTIHTIKGTCGFLNFNTLERITHHAENILSQVRNHERLLTPELVSITLETVDAVKAELRHIELTAQESGATYQELISKQEAIANGTVTPKSLVPCTPPAINEKVEEDAPPQHSNDRAPENSIHFESVSSMTVNGDAEASSPRNPSIADSTIRVDVGLLNKLMNLVGELVLARNQILQFSGKLEEPSLNTASQKLNLITTELQENVMKTRMQPIGIVWNPLPRVVRDLATTCGKQISLEMEGSCTELDKTILEAIKDPLTHIVRNACDHGIESPEARKLANKAEKGKLLLRAFHEGGNVNIEIIDDGAGIKPDFIKANAIKQGVLRQDQADRLNDRELVNLIFLPGFSTAQKISNISGRGVGMDVVRTNIERIGGTVDLFSKPGLGTTIRIKIPLTLAIIPGLVVTSANERFIIPQGSLLELIRLEGERARQQIEHAGNTLVYRRRGKLLPLTYLNTLLKVGPNTDCELGNEAINIVVLQADDREFGLVVDGINDTQEIVVKPLSNQLSTLKCYAGATIMGDGRVSLILDVPGVAKLSGIISEPRDHMQGEEAPPQTGKTDKQMFLLFRAGNFERLAVPLSTVARLEEIPACKIERAAGGMVVQYRGEVLPLVPLAVQLGDASSQHTSDPAMVIVFENGEHRIGLLIEQLIDIIEESVVAYRPAGHSGLLGSAVIGGKVTDLLDLHTIISNFEESWFDYSTDAPKLQRLATALGSRAKEFFLPPVSSEGRI
jgi:two-component system chemotaxis sensor kinase CheA